MSPTQTTDRSELSVALGHRDGQVAFNKPWELRVFAIATAACKAGEFEWSEFQEALTDAIKNWEAGNPGYTQEQWSYYDHFLTALEVVLARHDRISVDGVDERVHVILDHPPHKHHIARLDPITIDPARH